MNTLLLVLSHLACFVGGAVMWNLITKREVRAVTGEEEPLHPKNKHPFRGPRRGVVLLIVSVFFVTLGVQQLLFQDQKNKEQERQRQQNACIEKWGEETTETITLRSDATKELRKAEKRRDDKVDRILLLVIALRAEPPEATNDDFNNALLEFATAKANLDAVRKSVRSTTNENPYPLLVC